MVPEMTSDLKIRTTYCIVSFDLLLTTEMWNRLEFHQIQLRLVVWDLTTLSTQLGSNRTVKVELYCINLALAVAGFKKLEYGPSPFSTFFQIYLLPHKHRAIVRCRYVSEHENTANNSILYTITSKLITINSTNSKHIFKAGPQK